MTPEAPTFFTQSLATPRCLVFYSLEDWDEVWRRNQFICREWISLFPNLQILWISPTYDVSHNPLQVDGRVLKLHHSSEIPRLHIYKPLKFLPNRVSKKFNSWFMQAQVQSSLKQLSSTDCDVWINDQKARHYLPRSYSKIVYDITDDWTQFEQPPRIKQAVFEDDLWCVLNADAVIVCSDRLYQKNKQWSVNVHLIPNGVDRFCYHPDWLKDFREPPELKKLGNRIVWYIGTLDAERLDLELIIELAAILQDVSFVFIGPNAFSVDDSQRLTKQGNIHILGSRSYDELLSYVKSLDVCMTPHKVTAFTESLDPLKLYEYRATGKPVVATPCARFRDMAELVRIVDPEAVLLSLNLTNELAEVRLRWSSENSWSRRTDSVRKILRWQ